MTLDICNGETTEFDDVPFIAFAVRFRFGVVAFGEVMKRPFLSLAGCCLPDLGVSLDSATSIPEPVSDIVFDDEVFWPFRGDTGGSGRFRPTRGRLRRLLPVVAPLLWGVFIPFEGGVLATIQDTSSVKDSPLSSETGSSSFPRDHHIVVSVCS